MIILISSQGQSLESPIEPRFGRSPWLIKYDTETKESTALPNPGGRQSGGAGVAAAQFVSEQGADTVISGDFGPNAQRVLDAASITMIKFPDHVEQVKEIVDLVQKGVLS